MSPMKNPLVEEKMYTLKQWLFSFLMGLNIEFETLHSNILQWALAPSLEESILKIINDETSLNLLPPSQWSD